MEEIKVGKTYTGKDGAKRKVRSVEEGMVEFTIVGDPSPEPSRLTVEHFTELNGGA